jgi:hypothetical protein
MTPEVIDLLKQILHILGEILSVLTSIFGAMAMIVKFIKTLPEGHWFLPAIKVMGKLTNNQTDDNAIRQTQNSTQAT